MKKPKLFHWALWWGLGIVIACLAAIVIDAIMNMDKTGADEMSTPIIGAFYKLIYNFGIWPIVLYIGLIGPVVEELCFRLWGNGKQWTGYTSVVLMALWTISLGWWAAAIALGAGIAVMIVYHNDRTRRLFALWSMGLHILNNGVLAVIFGVGVGMAADTVTTAENKDCRITLRPVLTKSADKDTYVQGWLDDSTYTDIGTPGNIAQTLNSIAHMNGSTTQCDYEWSDYPKAEITVVMLGGCRDYTRAVRLMEEKQWIATDTVEHADSVRTMYVGDSSYTIAVERTVTIRNTYEPLSGI